MSAERALKLGVALGVAAGFVIFTLAAFKYTSKPKFCMSCHEIAPAVESWQESSHGKRDVKCMACHAEPGTIGYVKRKVFGLREVYSHITGAYGDTIVARVDESTCLRCHQDATRWKDTENLKFSHEFHLETQGLGCLKCHSRVVHGPRPAIPEAGPSHELCSTCHQVNDSGRCNSCHKP